MITPSSAKGSSFITTSEFRVEAQQLRRYAEAIGDRNPVHLEGHAAPPSFAVVPIVAPVVAARLSVSTLPGLHASHRLRIHAPIKSGMMVATTTRVSGVKATPAGLLISMSTCSTDGGNALNEQDFAVLVPSDRRQIFEGETAAPARFDPALRATACDGEISQTFSRALGRAYAEASGDLSPYTFDDEAARSRGLPGAIVGGICTMSFAIRAAIEALWDGDPERLGIVSLRFSNLLRLLDHQKLTWKFWISMPSGRAWRFEGYDQAGTVVVTHGLVETRS